jgi:hypothetical protein
MRVIAIDYVLESNGSGNFPCLRLFKIGKRSRNLFCFSELA